MWCNFLVDLVDMFFFVGFAIAGHCIYFHRSWSLPYAEKNIFAKKGPLIDFGQRLKAK